MEFASLFDSPEIKSGHEVRFGLRHRDTEAGSRSSHGACQHFKRNRGGAAADKIQGH
jgi:hypothetical protein